jgi:hypothetical protein
MKTKFDDNVAQNIPVTKNSVEPELPWKLSESEMTRIEATGEKHKDAITAPPLHARAIFVVLLVLTIFVVIMNSIVNMAIDNTEIRLNMSKKEKQVASIETALAAAASEKAALSDTTAKLEKRVSDLNAQKELYTAVIETLTKKTDDTQAN